MKKGKLAYKPHSVPWHARVVIIYLGMTLLPSSGNLPECHDRTSRSVGRRRTGIPSTLLGLAPGGVCLASHITAAAGGLLHHRFTLAHTKP